MASTDLAGVQKRVQYLNADDVVTVSVTFAGRGDQHVVRAECSRACWPCAGVRGGLTASWLIGVGRSAESAEARATRVRAMFERERKSHDSSRET